LLKPARAARRRRWLAAGIVSAIVHIGVFLGLALTTPRGAPTAQAPVFEVSLERSRPAPPPPKVNPLPRPAVSSPVQVHQPPATIPGAPTSGLPVASPGPASPSPTAPLQASAPPNPKLKLGCLHMGPAARGRVYGKEDCEVQRYAKIPGSSTTDPVFATPSNPAWDAQIAKQMRVHQPLPPEPPNRNDCANSNLGLGCTDQTLIPVIKRKF
jgi:hypothetical protein